MNLGIQIQLQKVLSEANQIFITIEMLKIIRTSLFLQQNYFRLLSHQNIFEFSKQKIYSEIKVNQYLAKRLQARRLIPLKDFQIQTLNAIQNGNNCFVNSCTGSGKTLSYLLPIMNRILKQKEDNQQKYMNKLNIYRKQKQDNRQNKKHGALIFSLNKELVLQIYKQIRLLDAENRLNTYRVGPISHFSPVVQQLVNPIKLQNKKNKTPDDEDIVNAKIQQNVVRCIDWKNTDLLVATPQMLYNVMNSYLYNKNNLINPAFVVIDQADLLMQIDQNVSQYMRKIISLIRQTNKKDKKRNLDNVIKADDVRESSTRFIMCSSSFPKKINKKPFLQYFEQKFSPIKIVSGINKHRLPDRLQLQYIQIQAQRTSHITQGEQVQRQKLFYIQKIITDPTKKNHRFLIFCNSKKAVQKIASFIKIQLSMEPLQYYASLNSDQRNNVLYKFNNQNFNILVSTDLGSRGLDFSRPINTIIQYQMAQNISNFINRAGRAGRNQLPGQIITFVQNKNKEFFKDLSETSSLNQQFDQLFSRKRSYSKLILKAMKNEQNSQKQKI